MDFIRAINIVINEAEYRLLEHGSTEVFEACRIVEQFVKYLPKEMVKDKMPNKQRLISYRHFYDDKEKMKDFNKLTKSEFLKSYSYITEKEYNLTRQEQKKKRYYV